MVIRWVVTDQIDVRHAVLPSFFLDILISRDYAGIVGVLFLRHAISLFPMVFMWACPLLMRQRAMTWPARLWPYLLLDWYWTDAALQTLRQRLHLQAGLFGLLNNDDTFPGNVPIYLCDYVMHWLQLVSFTAQTCLCCV